MRKARIKVANLVAVYHCISRIVGEEYLLDDPCKETLPVLHVAAGGVRRSANPHLLPHD